MLIAAIVLVLRTELFARKPKSSTRSTSASSFELGARGHAVYRDVDDGNDVTVWHDFNNLETAKAFANSNELKAAMKDAGVIGAPTVWFGRTPKRSPSV